MSDKESDKLVIKLIYVNEINYTLDCFANIVQIYSNINFSHCVEISYYSLSFFC